MRLIDADALMQDIKSNAYIIRDVFNSTDEGMSINGIRYAIDNTPTAITSVTPTEMTGEWVDRQEGTFCSECDYKTNEYHNFCPNCGAKMGGDTE